MSKLGHDTNVKDFEIGVSPTELNINCFIGKGVFNNYVISEGQSF